MVAGEDKQGSGRRRAHVALVSAVTVVSRLLGLTRDIFLYAVFGAGLLNSAFLLAFTVPNLLRRLFGEGALSSALVPVLSGSVEADGKVVSLELLNRVLSRVGLVLLAMVSGLSAVAVVVGATGLLTERWELAAGLAAWLFPYGFLICLAALLAAALSVFHRFLLGTLAQWGLNIGIIAGLGVGVALTEDATTRMAFVVGGVLVGGVTQLLLPAGGLLLQGWRPRLDFRPDDRLTELWRLFLPGVLGAAIYQINAAVGQVLAFWVDEAGVSILYLANRLMQLPLGVFVIAVATVSFPAISRFAARGDREGFARAYQEGASLILAITLPAAAGLFVLREPILTMLFQWGAFAADDVAATAPVLAVYALALPFYAVATFVTRGFHGQKDTVTPVRWSAISFGVNLVASLALMGSLGVHGLALANALAIVVQAVGLRVLLSRRFPEIARLGQWLAVTRLLAATGAMTLVVWLGAAWWGGSEPDQIASLRVVVAMIPVGMVVYALALLVLRAPEGKPLVRLLFRKSKPTTPSGAASE